MGLERAGVAFAHSEPGPAGRDRLATAASGFGYNFSRLLGPAVFGAAIAWLGASTPFWLFCVANLVAIAVLTAVHLERPGANLPPERVMSAILVGLRHAAHNRRLRATLARAGAFFLFASASSALLPLVARHALGRPEFYGALLSAVALGAIVGSVAFVPLRRRLALERVVVLGAVLMSVALVLFGTAHSGVVLIAASLVAGFAGMIALASFYVSAQEALPNWVRARGLAILLTVVFGAVSVGSAGWGEFASANDPSIALLAAAAGALLAIPLTWRWRLEDAADVDLGVSLHWRSMNLARRIDDDEGMVLVTIDYRVNPGDCASFLEAIQEMGHERRRDGAVSWGVFEDVEESGRHVETFLLDFLVGPPPDA